VHEFDTSRGKQWVARIEATLVDLAPPVRRVIEVDSTLTLSEFHTVLQAAFGWTDSHLHEFRLGHPNSSLEWFSPSPTLQVVFTDLSDADDDGPWWVETFDERLITVGQLCGVGRGLASYVYDFGDNWQHQLTLLGANEPKSVTPRARILEAIGPSGVEDSGGSFGLSELLLALADSSHPHHHESWEHVRFVRGPYALGYDVETSSVQLRNLEPAEINVHLLELLGTIRPGGPGTSF
jgi:hypothetical protein